MELESEEGAIIPIESGSNTEIGRGLGLGLGSSAGDRTVSRRHLSLHLLGPGGGDNDDECNRPDAKCRVSFEVIGKNPIWVCSGEGGDKRVYRRSEKGVLESGDRISLSLKNPFFLVLKRRAGGQAPVDKRVLDAVERRERRTLERRKEKESERAEVSEGEGDKETAVEGLEIEPGSVDVSQIDPVQEFKFLVKGHEFDHYPRWKIRAIKDWNWFLDEPGRGSDDDEVMTEANSAKGKGRRIKKTKGVGNEDDDWTGESEDEIELVQEVGSSKRPRYSTRSKVPKKPHNGSSGGKKLASQKNAKVHDDEFDEENEEDETLGGFIVDEEEVEVEEGEEEEDEEEEEELVDEEEYDDD